MLLLLSFQVWYFTTWSELDAWMRTVQLYLSSDYFIAPWSHQSSFTCYNTQSTIPRTLWMITSQDLACYRDVARMTVMESHWRTISTPYNTETLIWRRIDWHEEAFVGYRTFKHSKKEESVTLSIRPKWLQGTVLCFVTTSLENVGREEELFCLAVNSKTVFRNVWLTQYNYFRRPWKWLTEFWRLFTLQWCRSRIDLSLETLKKPHPWMLKTKPFWKWECCTKQFQNTSWARINTDS